MDKDIQSTALLIMDVQAGIVDNAENREAYLQKAATAVEYARKNGIQVIFVVVGFRAGFPEVSGENKVFGPIKQHAPATMVDPQPLISLEDGDVVVTKRRVSAFSGSDLEVILRSKGIRSLLLGGIMTSGVVLSTVREAADKDYEVTVLSDICADPNPDVQSILMEKVFPWQARVLTSEEWMNS